MDLLLLVGGACGDVATKHEVSRFKVAVYYLLSAARVEVGLVDRGEGW